MFDWILKTSASYYQTVTRWDPSRRINFWLLVNYILLVDFVDVINSSQTSSGLELASITTQELQMLKTKCGLFLNFATFYPRVLRMFYENLFEKISYVSEKFYSFLYQKLEFNKVRGTLLYCIWVKVFKNGPRKICGRQPLKNFEVIWSA